ncbi:kelch repeat-containing protein [Chryseolinea lacunae]|uniref:T9SS type A sorting domain-containing protein n=1 Tax=Chryseolinea lacunae TaxID=2801331 RepID=A0ABS1L0N7_9BACT|nr:kelch repeat-containing protein [Chryseolinea lacunae]MBL0745260.1 T9SS type A sorting domain-containing protein [Chryseolinea lacunae]
MKQFCLMGLLLLALGPVHSQTYRWTWKGGSKNFETSPTWGVRGVASATNTPGARQEALTWTTPDGAFWLWGGRIKQNLYSDLWRFDATTGWWTWMNGPSGLNAAGTYGNLRVETPGTNPGARRGAVGWVDDQGNLWMFGGRGKASLDVDPAKQEGYLNDVWKYVPAQNQWVWMAGAKRANEIRILGNGNGGEPGGRIGCTAWKGKDGNFYLFGGGWADGWALPNVFYNDLWRYDQTRNVWMWQWGDPPQRNWGDYGTLGVEAPCSGNASGPCNLPPKQTNATGWTDAEGNLWFFGGEPNGNPLFSQYTTHLWRYRPTSKRWTWMGGQAADVRTKLEGQYGTRGVASTNNLPMARSRAATWTDATGNLWLFGGDVLGTYGNDVWKLDAKTLEWTWVAGANLNVTSEPLAVFGTLNTTADTNQPGARTGAATWVDAKGNLWIYGGAGLGETSFAYGTLSDLWMLDAATPIVTPPPTPPVTPPVTPPTTPPTDPGTVTATEEMEQQRIHMFPNPVSEGNLVLEQMPREVRVEVMNIDGAMVWQREASVVEEVVVQGWPAGVYCVRVKARGEVIYVARFVKR